MPIEAPSVVGGGRKVRRSVRIERRRLLSALVALAFCLSAMFGLVVTSSSDRTDTTVREGPAGETTTAARTLALMAHDPIFIDGNAGFTNENGVVSGSGTATDPYIIEAWEINASGTNPTPYTQGAGLWIRNTNAYFIVQNVEVHDGGVQNEGIWLWNARNGAVRDCLCTDNDRGIVVLQSSNCQVIDNYCTMSYTDGIIVTESSDCIVANNACSSNLGLGLELAVRCERVTVTNNTLLENENTGINLDRAIECIITDNLIADNAYFGLQASYSSGNEIRNNNISFNTEGGVWLGSCYGNSIFENTIFRNHGYGVQTDDFLTCSENRIWNNSFLHNNALNTTYQSSSGQAYDSGTNFWNTSGTPHGYGNYWSGWDSPDDNGDAIVDEPYSISGPSNMKDFYPLATPPLPTPPAEENDHLFYAILGVGTIAACLVVIFTIAFLRRVRR